MLARAVFLLLLVLAQKTIVSGEENNSETRESKIVTEEASCAANVNGSASECANSTLELSSSVAAEAVSTPSSDGIHSRNESRRISCAAPLKPFSELVIFNASGVSEALSAARNECTLLVFYSPYCMFSARSAPYLNGIARYYPNVSVIALQINESSTLSMKYGIIALPTVLLLHNHRAIAKLNHTNVSLDALGIFIEKHTGLPLVENMTLSEIDYQGPLPSKVVERANWILFSAWIFTIMSLLWFVLKSSYALQVYNWLATTWKEAREAEQAARAHQD
jgi:thiol-disulfide isomerase/thioredoxin